MTKILAIAALGLLVTGCAVKNDRTDVGVGLAYHSDITKNADGTYSAAVETSLLRGRIGGAKALVTEDAVNKCRGMNKAMKEVKNETSSHFLVNGVAKLTFTCE